LEILIGVTLHKLRHQIPRFVECSAPNGNALSGGQHVLKQIAILALPDSNVFSGGYLLIMK
jgi:hypothetical protein